MSSNLIICIATGLSNNDNCVLNRFDMIKHNFSLYIGVLNYSPAWPSFMQTCTG